MTKIIRGKVHEYLGITLDYAIPCKVQVSMIPCINNIIDRFPEGIATSATTPTGKYLFQTCDQQKGMNHLSEEQAVSFHYTVAQLLFVSTRAWQHIQTPVAFLTTRVKRHTEDNW